MRARRAPALALPGLGYVHYSNMHAYMRLYACSGMYTHVPTYVLTPISTKKISASQVRPSIHPSIHPSVCPATQHHQHFEAQGRETPTEIKVRLSIFVCKVGMSDHGTWKRNFAEVVRVAHAADCKYDDLEMKLSGNGPWDLGVARRQLGCPVGP